MSIADITNQCKDKMKYNLEKQSNLFKLNKFKFDDKARVIENNIETQSSVSIPEKPIATALAILINDTNIEQTDSTTLTTSSEKTTSTTVTNGYTIGGSMSTKFTENISVLFLQMELEHTFSISGQYNRTDSTTVTQSESVEFSKTLQVTIPSKKKVRVSLIVMGGAAKIPFKFSADIQGTENNSNLAVYSYYEYPSYKEKFITMNAKELYEDDWPGKLPIFEHSNIPNAAKINGDGVLEFSQGYFYYVKYEEFDINDNIEKVKPSRIYYSQNIEFVDGQTMPNPLA